MLAPLIETGKVGKRGVYTIPASMRRRYGFTDGSLVIAEERTDGILLKSALAMPVEIYTDERIAEFLLSNSCNDEEYAEAHLEVQAMGLDPNQIVHFNPNE